MKTKEQKKFLLFIFIFLLIPIFVKGEGLIPCGGENEPHCQFCHFFNLIDNIIKFLLIPSSDNHYLPPALIFAGLLIAIGGLKLIISFNPKTINETKSLFKAVIIGLLIVYCSWLTINLFFLAIGVGEWTGLKEGWYKINCPIVEENIQSPSPFSAPSSSPTQRQVDLVESPVVVPRPWGYEYSPQPSISQNQQNQDQQDQQNQDQQNQQNQQNQDQQNQVEEEEETDQPVYGYDMEDWQYQYKIDLQVSDASPELKSFLSCMRQELNKIQKEKNLSYIGVISSISDSHIKAGGCKVWSSPSCGLNCCQKGGDGCQHSCTSYHYGYKDGKYKGKSYAVDFGDEKSLPYLKSAALKCNKNAWVNPEGNHIHIQIPIP